MSEPASEPIPSLIQQRKALMRERNMAMLFLIVFGCNATWWVLRGIFDDAGVIVWILGIAFLLIVAMSVYLLVSARRKLRAFADEHGPDAGKQL